MKLSIACDHGGYEYKCDLIKHLQKNNYEVIDFGCNSLDSCDYPDFSLPAAEAIKEGVVDFGIFICSTGIGISIVANKVPGVRCAHCHDVESAKLTRNHNNANAIAFGAKIISKDLMFEIVDTFLASSFDGGRHQRRVDKISAVEQKYCK